MRQPAAEIDTSGHSQSTVLLHVAYCRKWFHVACRCHGQGGNSYLRNSVKQLGARHSCRNSNPLSDQSALKDGKDCKTRQFTQYLAAQQPRMMPAAHLLAEAQLLELQQELHSLQRRMQQAPQLY